MATRFCPYCRQHKEDEGFKAVFHKSGNKRMQCPTCQATRKQPREKLEEMARQDGEARRRQISEATKRGIEQRRKNGTESS